MKTITGKMKFAQEFLEMRKKIQELKINAMSYAIKNSSDASYVVKPEELHANKERLAAFQKETPEMADGFVKCFYSEVAPDVIDKDNEHMFSSDRKSVAKILDDFTNLYLKVQIFGAFTSKLNTNWDGYSLDFEKNTKELKRFNCFSDLMKFKLSRPNTLERVRDWMWCYGSEGQRRAFEERIFKNLSDLYSIYDMYESGITRRLSDGKKIIPSAGLNLEDIEVVNLLFMLRDSIAFPEGNKRTYEIEETKDMHDTPSKLIRLARILINDFDGREVSSAEVKDKLGTEPTQLTAVSKNRESHEVVEYAKRHLIASRGRWKWKA